MKKHQGKMVAPVVITVLIVLYYFAYFGFLVMLVGGLWRWILGIVPLALAVAMIHVCIQRIQEIKGGEEDDLGQY